MTKVYENMTEKFLNKRFTFKELELVSEEYYEEQGVHYYTGTKQGNDVEVKVEFDSTSGAYTEFTVEYRMLGNEDWIYLHTEEVYYKEW